MRYHKLKAGVEPGTYVMESSVMTEQDILTMANQLAKRRLSKGRRLSNPLEVKAHLMTLFQHCEHEIFSILLLDNQHRIIGLHELFHGTINMAVVHPREVVKLTLKHNAAAVILIHNHPSGNPEPSRADIAITKQLKKTLDLVTVNVIDHIIVGAEECTSLAEKGLI